MKWRFKISENNFYKYAGIIYLISIIRKTTILQLWFLYKSLLSSEGQTLYIESMAKNNITTVTEFILIGFNDHPKWEIPLFLVFLSFYLVTMLGNLGMVILIHVDVQLHIPMYFFLSHLSVLDAWQRWLQVKQSFPIDVVLPSSSSSLSVQLQNVSCCLWWPMIAMLLLAIHCSIL